MHAKGIGKGILMKYPILKKNGYTGSIVSWLKLLCLRHLQIFRVQLINEPESTSIYRYGQEEKLFQIHLNRHSIRYSVYLNLKLSVV